MCWIGVPIRTRALPFRVKASPVIVTILETSGLPFLIASFTAKAVPTLFITIPSSEECLPIGVCSPVMTSINCFALPDG